MKKVLVKRNFFEGFAMVSLICLSLVSCGEKSKDATLTPTSTIVSGDLKEYFTVVDKPITVKYDENAFSGKYMITVELQRTNTPFAFDSEGLEPVGISGESVTGNYGIGIDVLDTLGNVVLTVSPTASGLGGVYSYDDLIKLMGLGEGETAFVRWSTNEFEKYEDKNFIFKISSSLSITKNKTVQKSSSDDCSDFLDEYEEFVNDYIAIVKKYKADPTDMSVLEDYQEMVEKATDMQKEAKNCKGSKYVKRVNQLNQKLAKAMY